MRIVIMMLMWLPIISAEGRYQQDTYYFWFNETGLYCGKRTLSEEQKHSPENTKIENGYTNCVDDGKRILPKGTLEYTVYF